MVELIKVWAVKDKQGNDTATIGSKQYFHYPTSPIEGIEECKLKSGSNEVECTKIFYANGRFIIIMGTPFEFMQKCREANTAISILSDLYSHGITMKQFLEENERKNNVQLM